MDAIEMLDEADYIYVCIDDLGRSRVYSSVFPYFTLWAQKCPDKPRKVVVPSSHFWDPKKGSYAMNVYGTDRVFELLYSISWEKSREWESKTVRMW